MKNMQNHTRNYKLVENKLNKLFSVFFVSDQSLDQPSPYNSIQLHEIVPCIENLAKALHKELSLQFPNLQQFKDGEHFDFAALAFLDKALGLSNKQVKISSDLVALSDDKRLITPLKGAHEQDKSLRPLWSQACQSNKNDLANTQNLGSASTPTPNGKAAPQHNVQTLIEAAGAAFLLLSVAKSLPLTHEVPYNQCDFKFGSDIFTATYTRPLFNNFFGTMSKNCLQFDQNWEQQLFVVKDPDSYIASLRAKTKENNQQFKNAISSNSDFTSFLNNLTEDRKHVPVELLLHWYGQETKDPAQKQWSRRVKDLSFSVQTNYLTAWTGNHSDQLKRLGFDPVVALNYRDADHLYNYAKLSQDTPTSK